MPYLIDGHNLIPRLPGFSLADLDDEQRLLELLQDFCRARRQQVEVFFDQAPAGQARKHTYGSFVKAHFVHHGMIADEAIRRRLEELGRQARNWTVVSNDRVVQAEARAVQAHILSSDEFARLLQSTLDDARLSLGGEGSGKMSEAELREWMELFKDNKPSPGKPKKKDR